MIDVFVDELDLGDLGFSGVDPEATGNPSLLLKLYIYGYLNRVQSSPRLERPKQNTRRSGSNPRHCNGILFPQ